MRKRNENRHGVTLVELVVVLAILSIVTTMVVSFNVIVNQRRAESQAKLEVLQDVRVAEAMIESWINSTKIEKIESITDGSAILTSREDEKNIVKFNDGVLEVGDNTITLDRVTGISFKEIFNFAPYFIKFHNLTSIT